jgi:hypothetical protein
LVLSHPQLLILFGELCFNPWAHLLLRYQGHCVVAICASTFEPTT